MNPDYCATSAPAEPEIVDKLRRAIDLNDLIDERNALIENGRAEVAKMEGERDELFREVREFASGPQHAQGASSEFDTNTFGGSVR